MSNGFTSYKNGTMPDYVKMTYLMLLKYQGYVAKATMYMDEDRNSVRKDYQIVAGVRGVGYELILRVDSSGEVEYSHSAARYSTVYGASNEWYDAYIGY